MKLWLQKFCKTWFSSWLIKVNLINFVWINNFQLASRLNSRVRSELASRVRVEVFRLGTNPDGDTYWSESNYLILFLSLKAGYRNPYRVSRYKYRKMAETWYPIPCYPMLPHVAPCYPMLPHVDLKTPKNHSKRVFRTKNFFLKFFPQKIFSARGSGLRKFFDSTWAKNFSKSWNSGRKWFLGENFLKNFSRFENTFWMIFRCFLGQHGVTWGNMG